MKTELQSRTHNGGTFRNTDLIDSTIRVATPMPLRLPVGTRLGRPIADRIVNARRLTGVAILRIAFGAIWAVDASLKWQPAFQANFQQMLTDVAKGQPGFLGWWFALWQFVVSGRAPVFGILTASTETYLALALLTGFARKFTYSLGILYGMFVWSVAEGFGGPYRPGTTTDVGAAIIYSLLFGALLLVDAGRLSVDALIEKRLFSWRRIAELRP
jgi:nitrite reductase (NO-forming)